MSKIATLKAQAKNLKLAMAGMGIPLSQAQSLEAVAQQYGKPNWDTLSGILKKEAAPARAPRLADMPYEPSDIWIESGLYSEKYAVADYAYEALNLFHDEKAFREFVETYPEEYTEGMESTAIGLEGNGEDVKLTFNQLIGMRYADVGMGNWELSDGRFLRFCCDDIWRPENEAKKSKTELTVPELVKSAKGCNLVILPSGDGATYDRHVIVPPHLDADVISERISGEILRLKALDKENEDVPGYDEYTDTDLSTFVASIGCLWVEDYKTTSENWD